MNLTRTECQSLIGADYKWATSQILRDGLVRDDSFIKRTFKESPINVLSKHYPEIRKEIITRYDVGDFCSLHRDNKWLHEHQDYRAYAVWITPLNDNYEGGELYVGGVLIEQEVGKTIKNNSQIRHKITEVTEGTRYSLVSWVFCKKRS